MPCEAEMPCTTISSFACESVGMGQRRRTITAPTGDSVNSIYRVKPRGPRAGSPSGNAGFDDEGGRPPCLADCGLDRADPVGLVEEGEAGAAAAAHPRRHPELAAQPLEEEGQRGELGERRSLHRVEEE